MWDFILVVMIIQKYLSCFTARDTVSLQVRYSAVLFFVTNEWGVRSNFLVDIIDGNVCLFWSYLHLHIVQIYSLVHHLENYSYITISLISTPADMFAEREKDKRNNQRSFRHPHMGHVVWIAQISLYLGYSPMLGRQLATDISVIKPAGSVFWLFINYIYVAALFCIWSESF